MTKKTLKYIHLRESIVGILFFCGLMAIGGFAAYLQVFKGQWLSRKAAGQYEKSVTLVGSRGTIYDAQKREMAVSIDTTSIAAHPSQIKDPKKTAKILATALKLNRAAVLKKITANKPFVWIKRQVSPRDVARVRESGVAGIAFIPEHSRFYPNKQLAAQVLGFTGIDGRGLEGIEFYYNKYLTGTPRQVTIRKDALGRDFDYKRSSVLSTQGNSLVLTIDRTIQFMVEEALRETVEKYAGRSGIAVVMAPVTGEILAMAHFPFFNPNSYGQYHRDLWRNRAITDAFEPGSTMKIFSAAAALDSGTSGPNTIYFCENGKYAIGPNTVHDTKPHGWLSLQQVVKYSSNIGAIKVVERMGSKPLYTYLKTFGFGEKTGIDSPGESYGSLSSYRHWTKIDTGTIAFGQGVATTALQLITAASAIANDGIMMKPYFVKAILDPNGREIVRNEPVQLGRVISTNTARTMRRILKTVITEGGTGVQAALNEFSVGGKTGTAQKIEEGGGYSKDRFIASFLGFAPADRPEAVALILVDEPQGQHYGGIVAAPGFKRIMYKTLTYFDTKEDLEPGNLTIALEDDNRG
ncbi:MAG: penicillin-binding protein 2 [Desulfobacteraceae bacterium]|nr:penicillin-binding protein 2 [Desulfobacteraceae bacterium]